MRRRRRADPALAAALAIAALVTANPLRADGHAARFTLDNDQFNFWEKPGDRPDFGYTHGTELALHFPHAPRRLVRLVPAWLVGAAGGETALEIRIRQSIYSPWTLPPDRPYAGWLEIAGGISRSSEREGRELLIHAGVTGPPSLAGKVQDYFHRRFDHSKDPPDWSGQLPFEPGLGIEVSRAWLAHNAAQPNGWRSYAGPYGRVRVGTYADDARLTLNFALGLRPPEPWPSSASPKGPSLYLRAAPKLDLIARDEFLDGPLFRQSVMPGASPVVAESELAIGAGTGHARLEWAVMRRTKEFKQQPEDHTYASITLTWLP